MEIEDIVLELRGELSQTMIENEVSAGECAGSRRGGLSKMWVSNAIPGCFKGPGMQWSRRGAERLLPVRTTILSNRFDELWYCFYNSPQN